MPQYLLLLRGGTSPEPDATPDQLADWIRPYQEWLDRLRKEETLVDANRLQPTQRWLGADPPALPDTRDLIGGYYRIRCADLDTATAIARDCPHLANDGSIEVRALMGER